MSEHPDPTRLGREGLDPPERAALLAHVARCAACRGRLAAEDPSLLFSLLGLVAPPPDALERLSERVLAALPPGARGPRLGRGRLVGALAAAIVLAAVLAGVLWRSGAPAPRGGPAALGRPADVARPAAVGFGVEIHAPESAQLIDLSLGDTQLILIFDEGLEL